MILVELGCELENLIGCIIKDIISDIKWVIVYLFNFELDIDIFVVIYYFNY